MDYTLIVSGIMTVIVGIISAYIVPWLRSSMGEAAFYRLMDYVRLAVRAAEQLAAVNGHDGAWKKKYVEDYLLTRGIKIDLSDMDVMIEAAVIELHNALAPITPEEAPGD